MGRFGLARGIVSVEFRAPRLTETCVGIILKRKPLTLLVPQHAAQMVEDEPGLVVLIDGVQFGAVMAVPESHLTDDHLVILRLSKPQESMRELKPIPRLPRVAWRVSPGDPVAVVSRLPGQDASTTQRGKAISVSTDLDGGTVITDIPVQSGQSGSPIFYKKRLYAVVQGHKRDVGSSGFSAIGIPLTSGALRQLRRIHRIKWRAYLWRAATLALLMAAPLILLLDLGGRNYPVEGVEVLEDQQTIRVHRNAVFPARSSWTFTTQTKIFTTRTFSSDTSDPIDLVAVGSAATTDGNGALYVLNSSGKLLWQYSVPEGECSYEGPDEETFDRFSTTHIYPSDLDLDGKNELIVAFAHQTWYPAKIMVFDIGGSVLAEYWHPGYVRTLVSGLVGEEKSPITVISASNNSLKASWWNPQVIFAFRGLEIEGQGPTPLLGESAGSQIWYWVINNIDPEVFRAKATQLAVVDQNGDGITEIRAQLSDGRFYYFSAAGDVVGTAAGDIYLRDYGDTPFPKLNSIQEYLDGLSVPQDSESSGPETGL
ncbi:serine protease [Candidatus Bipolaricaulota bacterium]|nr:serine protease [Candidatus Bipolaricaulota bacterium]